MYLGLALVGLNDPPERTQEEKQRARQEKLRQQMNQADCNINLFLKF